MLLLMAEDEYPLPSSRTRRVHVSYGMPEPVFAFAPWAPGEYTVIGWRRPRFETWRDEEGQRMGRMTWEPV